MSERGSGRRRINIDWFKHNRSVVNAFDEEIFGQRADLAHLIRFGHVQQSVRFQVRQQLAHTTRVDHSFFDVFNGVRYGVHKQH